jgi:hypothetical protein
MVRAPPGVGMFAPLTILRNASRAKSEGRAKVEQTRKGNSAAKGIIKARAP